MKLVSFTIFYFFLAHTAAMAQRETPALYPGGNNAYYTFLDENLSYPESAITSQSDRTIKVIVKIDEKGKASIQEFVYANSGLGFEDEVTAFINKMPNWIPADHSGVKTASQIVLSFDFKFVHESDEEAETYELEYYEEGDIPAFYAYGMDTLNVNIKRILKDSLHHTEFKGTCTIDFFVDTSGRIVNTSILENTSNIEDADINFAFLTLQGWFPGLLMGKKVTLHTQVKLHLN